LPAFMLSFKTQKHQNTFLRYFSQRYIPDASIDIMK
jgi:hypothetical protein